MLANLRWGSKQVSQYTCKHKVVHFCLWTYNYVASLYVVTWKSHIYRRIKVFEPNSYNSKKITIWVLFTSCVDLLLTLGMGIKCSEYSGPFRPFVHSSIRATQMFHSSCTTNMTILDVLFKLTENVQ